MKKHRGLLILLIVLLVGCGHKENAIIEDQGVVETHLPETGLYPIGKPLVADFNGDGLTEELLVEILPPENATQDDRFQTLTVTINGNDYTDVVGETGGFNPNTEYFYLARLDTEEAWMAIGLLYNGPSADPKTHFYRYTNRFEYLNEVPNYPYMVNGELVGATVDESGILHTSMGLSIFQTWSTPVEWILDENGALTMVEQELYYPYQITEQEIKLLCNLPLYEEPGDKENMTSTKTIAPQTVRITATDNEHWCYLEGTDGTTGWFYVENYYELPDLGLTAPEVFDGLYYAG